MHRSTPLLREFLTAPDGGLPGIPGSGSSGAGGGLPGIPGSGPLSGGTPQPPAPSAQPAPPAPGLAPPGGPVPPATPVFSQAQPPQIPGMTYELAGWGSRFAAYLLDVFLMLLIAVPFFFIAAAIGVDTGSSSSGDGSFEFSSQNGQVLAVFGIFLIVAFLYAPTTMVWMKGSTPGKAMLGIRVVRANGQPVTFGWALLREWVLKGIVVGIVNSFTLGLGGLLNYLWPLWDSENRALHDMAAGSRVVRR
jgi:uncharacterized RDD family membrane protein YckC